MIKREFTIIACCIKQNMGIGYKNKLPFVCPEEMKHFRETTSKTEDPQKKNLVIMGKNTWNSLHP